jgi:chemotaxis protein methyltransferase WspC
MGQTAIESFIHQATGLNANMMGSGVITNAINRRRRVLQIPSAASYWTYLQQHPPEQQALIETVVIPETWFFRDRTPFQYLTHHLQQVLKTQTKRSPLRILSLPCSTGEEPYSIVMALLNAGIPKTRFTVDAIDISQHNIHQAQLGSYGPFSFRHGDPQIQQQFFTLNGDRYHIHSTVKDCVQFSCANVLKPQTWQQKLPYDIIFCRNLLIYFDDSTRQKVLTFCQKALHPSGILFVGHAESGILLNQQWRSLRIPFTFAYQLPIATPTAPHTPLPFLKTLAQKRPKPPSPSASDPPNPTDAQTLANAGQLDRAAEQCHQILRTYPLHLETHLLLGEIHQAQNQNPLAEQWFAKALYLAPDSVAALTYLERLLRAREDTAGADRLQARIQRLSV